MYRGDIENICVDLGILLPLHLPVREIKRDLKLDNRPPNLHRERKNDKREGT
jgi:hypothetical protein